MQARALQPARAAKPARSRRRVTRLTSTATKAKESNWRTGRPFRARAASAYRHEFVQIETGALLDELGENGEAGCAAAAQAHCLLERERAGRRRQLRRGRGRVRFRFF